MKKTNFHIEQTGRASAVLLDDEEKIAEIRELKFCNVRLQPHGSIIISESVPMPLFWWQYANHQHPERNAGSNGRISNIKQNRDEISFRCQSQNQSGSAVSQYEVNLTYSSAMQSYVYAITATLVIPDGKNWVVTPNPAHGEIEFCNFMPKDVFSTDPKIKKRYQACFIKRSDRVLEIPHHHLETADKSNILLESGDKFFWALEEINPVIEILSNGSVCAGVCAYMWDTHFGYRICQQFDDVTLTGGQEFHAKFKLYAIDEKIATELIKNAQEPPVAEILDIPIYVTGLNSFSKSLFDFPDKFDKLWQWNFESNSENAKGSLDRQQGFSDQNSLKIENHQPTESSWLATSIGPAYGDEPIPNGARLKLSAMVRVNELNGRANIAIRFFSAGMGDIFDIANYQIIGSKSILSREQDWTRIEIMTSPLSPAPERVHLLLRLSGTGKAWFDDVILEKIVS